MKAKKVVHNFFELDRKDRKMFMLQVNTISTIAVGLFKLLFGILYSSIWFYINAVFYAILGYSKYRSIRDYRRIKKTKNIKTKKSITYKNYLYNGLLLVLLGIAYFLINLMILKTGKTNNNLKGYLIYITVILSISSITTAIISLTKYNHKDDPIVAAACQGNISKALTSVVLAQVVLLDEFGPHTSNIIKIDAITGFIVGIIIVMLGIRMVFKIKKEHKIIYEIE